MYMGSNGIGYPLHKTLPTKLADIHTFMLKLSQYIKIFFPQLCPPQYFCNIFFFSLFTSYVILTFDNCF